MPKGTPTPRVPEKTVTMDQYGKEWPFIYPAGVLRCEDNAVTIAFLTVGETYTLNGRAASRYPHLPRIHEVKMLHPDHYALGLRMSHGVSIDDGLDMCAEAERADN